MTPYKEKVIAATNASIKPLISVLAENGLNIKHIPVILIDKATTIFVVNFSFRIRHAKGIVKTELVLNITATTDAFVFSIAS